MKATPALVGSLRYFRWAEFRRPEQLHWPFLQWLDEVRHRAAVPFVLTSDARDHIPPGGSATSLHLQGRAVDLRYPFSATGRTNGAVLAAITEAIVTTPRPAGEGGYEYGIEPGAPGGPHLHIGLFPGTQRGCWLFTR